MKDGREAIVGLMQNRSVVLLFGAALLVGVLAGCVGYDGLDAGSDGSSEVDVPEPGTRFTYAGSGAAVGFVPSLASFSVSVVASDGDSFTVATDSKDVAAVEAQIPGLLPFLGVLDASTYSKPGMNLLDLPLEEGKTWTIAGIWGQWLATAESASIEGEWGSEDGWTVTAEASFGDVQLVVDYVPALQAITRYAIIDTEPFFNVELRAVDHGFAGPSFLARIDDHVVAWAQNGFPPDDSLVEHGEATLAIRGSDDLIINMYQYQYSLWMLIRCTVGAGYAQARVLDPAGRTVHEQESVGVGVSPQEAWVRYGRTPANGEWVVEAKAVGVMFSHVQIVALSYETFPTDPSKKIGQVTQELRVEPRVEESRSAPSWYSRP